MYAIIWQISPQAAQIEVPKLILQPIVENCFKHSFHNQEGMKQIKIINQCDAERWSIEVRNNGEPMTPETIESIYRLFLFYKGDETFHISLEGQETVVKIGGPIHGR